jgi:hypothetical protein
MHSGVKTLKGRCLLIHSDVLMSAVLTLAVQYKRETSLLCAATDQNHWVFGIRPSSGILENIKHKVSENGSVSVLT